MNRPSFPIRHLWALLILCLYAPLALAQQPLPCNITITSNFESQCILPRDKDDFVNEEPETIIACQGSTVTYTAHVNTGAASVTEWNWEVAGGTLTPSANVATVEWGSDPQGQITLTIVTDSGTSCSLTINVRLIEKPSILVSTVPSYSELPDGSKVIYVCQGETVEFTDLSSTTSTDIVGYFWDSPFYNLTASSPNFRIENVWHEDQVIHRVYNNCGCYNEETYIIKVMHGDILDLGCYGTVCQDAVVTYTANNPPCSQYSWYVDGGTIIGAQDQQSVTVQWDNPQNGYGIIGLDGSLCGGNACPSMLSKKIPIIQKGVTVKGQDIVCVDEAVIYSVPLYGSTEYHWSIQPTTGVSLFDVNGANQQMVEFHQPGIYHLHVSYKCDFLECGEFSSDTLTIHVKPRLSIVGHDRICINNPCDLVADPSAVVSWEVQDISNSYQPIHSETSNILSWTFPHTGKYQVTATHPDYCRPAILIVTVVDAPPAPTINDMDPNNPSTACLNSAILLKANPTNPDYSIVWQPPCDEASPSSASGNEVTISYGNDVCDVHAYNYDHVLGCLSSDYYIHQVDEFLLADLDLPSNITVCPGTILSWTNDNVPYQDKVIYEWQIQPTAQFCASVQGDIFNNTITLLVNELISPNSYPTTFSVSLTRTYCSNIKDVFVINITIDDNLSPTLMIDPIGPICVGDHANLVGHGCDNDHYLWNVQGDNHTYSGNPIDYTFLQSGNINVTLSCNPYDVCNNSAYLAHTTIQANVNPIPPIESIGYDGDNVYTVPQLSSGYSYSWSHTTINSSIVPIIPGIDTYTCTITSQNSPYCSTTRSIVIDTEPHQPCRNLRVFFDGIDYCAQTISFHVANYPGMVQWYVIGNGSGSPVASGVNNQSVSIPISDVGTYYISASIQGTPCYYGSTSCIVDFLPDFSFEKACDRVIIHNNSKYLDANKSIQLSVNGNALPPIVVNTPSQIYYTGAGGYFSFSLASYDNNIINCSLETVYINNTGGDSLTITADNPTTCDNIPILLTATPALGDVFWNFGDGSTYSSISNTVLHTFAGGRTYSVIATAYNSNGCPSVGTISMNSFSNTLKQESLETNNTTLVCPGSIRIVHFLANSATPPFPTVWYHWDTPPFTTYNSNNTHVTYYTNDYEVTVTNQHGCKAKASCNVEFLNKPTATIVSASSIYCEGEEIQLFGAPDPNTSNYTFSWSITETSSGQVLYFSNPTISFVPAHSGLYQISLCITDNTTTCSDCKTETIYVNPTPAAPTISFGSNECIDNPPVVLNGSATATSDINWSNGNVGPNAYYFSPGMATAWYYDPNTGCKSEEAKIHIEPQPDFDALLTGCYEKCRAFFETNPRLPVWGLSSGRENILWDWRRNSSGIANGIVFYPNYSLSLPLQGFGDYNLNLDYHNGNCGTLISPTLTINPKDTCDCQDLDVSYKYEWHVEDCRIYYDVDVTVCNNSTTRDCLRNIEYLFNKEFIRVVYTDFASTTLNPGDCYSFHLTILASQFLPSSTISFRLYDECNNCTTDFSINLMPEKIDCEMDMQLLSLDINPGLSSSVAAYFDFNFDVSPCQNLIAFWTEPPMVINYWYDGAAMVQGLGMVDYATLTQLMAENGNICFYAITCEGDHLCKRKFCIPAGKIYNMLISFGIESRQANAETSSNEGKGASQTANPEAGNLSEPRLMPNPTTGEVNVIGTADEVVEVLVMDMNGRQMATFVNAKRFNIAHLATGHYIVRVKTHRDNTDKVTYLKLVKK